MKKCREMTSDIFRNNLLSALAEIDIGSNALSVRMDRTNRIALDREVFERYFKGVPKKEVVNIVQKALEMYFKSAGA